MLNGNGRYYVADILDSMEKLKNNLFDQGLLKARDLGDPTNMIPISNVVKIEFLANKQAEIDVEGYSKKIIESIRVMGEENLVHKDLGKLREYYSELERVYNDNTITMKSYEYFRIFSRLYLDVKNELENAKLRSLRGEEAPKKREGISVHFETGKKGDVVTMSNSKEDIFHSRRFFSMDVDVNILGIKIPDKENVEGDYKYVQIDKKDVFLNGDKVSVNICFDSEQDLDNKVYPVTRTFENKNLRTVAIISPRELIQNLHTHYNATITKELVSNDEFYEQAKPGDEYFINNNSVGSIINLEKGRNRINGTSIGERAARILFSRRTGKGSRVKGKSI